MTNVELPPALPRTDSSEFEHKALVEIGKMLIGSFYLLAPMSFVLNGTLLGAVSFLVYQKANIKPEFLQLSVYFTCLLGVIYNLGAFCSMLSSTITVLNLRKRFAAVDARLGLHISECRTPLAEGVGDITLGLTAIFFTIWAGSWIYLAYANYTNAIIK